MVRDDFVMRAGPLMATLGTMTDRTLTDGQGHPIADNQNMKTVGERGPTTLENYHFIEKISHFDRERIPERVVHARGTGAHGYFEASGRIGDEPASTYTRAKLFQREGKRTAVFVRFSTVIGGRDSSEVARDPRGFATKFYSEDGNWDLVGNNLPVFFIRDAMKFPDLIHALKPDPVTFRQEPNRIFDFMSNTPESMHVLTWLFSPRGIPASYRHQDGFGVNTYKLVNARGQAVLVKYHWKTRQGIRSLTQEQADAIQARELGSASKDLYDAIGNGEYPEWELCVQIMSDDEHPELEFDPLDDTKVWPEDRFPLRHVGRMVLDRVPQSHFTETEQVAFGAGVLVDGLDFSDDKMLQGRTFSYSDTQRYRVGPNYLQLSINQPKKRVATDQRDGQMAAHLDVAPGADPHVNYEPSGAGLREAAAAGPPHYQRVDGRPQRTKIARTNDYQQAGERYRSIESWERDDLVKNLIDQLRQCDRQIQEKMVSHFALCDADLGGQVAAGIGMVGSQPDLLPVG